MREKGPMEKNQQIQVTIEALSSKGEGIATVDGMKVFVPFALVGEKVTAKVIFVRKTYAIAKLIEVHTPAEDRVRPFCPVFQKCGGCQLQHIKYPMQLRIKTKNVSDCLKKIAKLDVNVPLCVKCDSTKEYRNKMQLPVAQNGKELLVGFFAPNSHRIVPTKECKLHGDWCEKVIDAITAYAKIENVSGYDEMTGTGLLRHVVVRSVNQKLLITLVINGQELPRSETLISLLEKRIGEFGLYINVNRTQSNVILGDYFFHCHGLTELTITGKGLTYRVGPKSFVQVNDQIAAKIYDRAVLEADLTEEDVVINAYSGAGLLTAQFARACKMAYGVEIIDEATKSANALARENGLENKMCNITGDCAKEVARILKETKETAGRRVLVLDPPRKGCDLAVLSAAREELPERIIYISCNPATLARDVGILMGTLAYDENGELLPVPEPTLLYELSFVQPYDMFPQTAHVESLVCLQRQTN